MNKKITVPFIVLFLILVGGTMIYAKRSPQDSIKIGFIGFPTGPFSALGEIQINAAKMAVDDINKKGGINGRTLELVVEDYGYDAKRAIPAYEALKAKGIKFFDAEGSFAGTTIPPIIRKDGNFMMNAVLVLPSYTDNDPRTCRISLKASDYAPAISNYILHKFKNPKIAFLVVQNDYGVQIKTAIEAIIRSNGGEIIDSEMFEQTTTDFRAQIASLKAHSAQIDAVVVINPGNAAETMYKQIKELGLNKPIVGDNWTGSNPSIKTISLIEGVVFADYPWTSDSRDSDSPEAARFKKAFLEKYDQQASPIAVNTYDTINLLAVGLSNASAQTPDAVASYLTTRLGDYNGIGGQITFNADCEAQRNVMMKTIKNGIPVDLITN